MRISDWSSDVCSSDLRLLPVLAQRRQPQHAERKRGAATDGAVRYFGKLEAATAEVDRHAVRVGNGGQHTATCRLGLFRAREQADVEPGPGGAGNEVAAAGPVAHPAARAALQILPPPLTREHTPPA